MNFIILEQRSVHAKTLVSKRHAETHLPPSGTNETMMGEAKHAMDCEHRFSSSSKLLSHIDAMPKSKGSKKTDIVAEALRKAEAQITAKARIDQFAI